MVIEIVERHRIEPFLFGVFHTGTRYGTVHFSDATPEQFYQRLKILDEGVAKLMNPTHVVRHNSNILDAFCRALEIESCAVAGSVYYQCLC